jgi:hypothetical protein
MCSYSFHCSVSMFIVISSYCVALRARGSISSILVPWSQGLLLMCWSNVNPSVANGHVYFLHERGVSGTMYEGYINIR